MEQEDKESKPEPDQLPEPESESPRKESNYT